MPITLGTNIASLASQRELDHAADSLSKVYERLSSGLRINSPADDAAGLAVASSLTAKQRVFAQGVRNLNDGISAFNIVDASLQQLTSITTRLKELSEEAANGTLGPAQRGALDKEAQALSKEFTRISQTTQFNGLSLLNGSVPTINLQAGFGSSGSIAASIGGAIGTGSLATPVSFTPGTAGNFAVAAADLNGDGIEDLVTGGQGPSSGEVYVQLGNGNGTFGATVSYATLGDQTTSVTLGDFNNDGVMDIASVGIIVGAGDAAVTVRLGNTNGTFQAATSFDTGFQSGSGRGITVGDLNGDGKLDIVTVTGNTSDGHILISLGNGNGTFAGPAIITDTDHPYSSVALGDLNGDGVLDVVTAGYTVSGSTASFAVRFGNGSGGFGAPAHYTDTSGAFNSFANSLALGDLNGDGALDVVLATNYGVEVWSGGGSGTFSGEKTYATTETNSLTLALGDLNGDGILDVVTAGSGGQSVRFGTGNGTLGSLTSYNSLSGRGITLGDFNGDGVLDLAAVDNSFGETELGVKTSGVNPLLPFSLTTRTGALQAMPLFDQKLQQLTLQLGTIGANESRINVATNVLNAMTENYQAAASRIMDADIATETANLTRLQILQQVGAAVLSHANLQPQLALKLLQ